MIDSMAGAHGAGAASSTRVRQMMVAALLAALMAASAWIAIPTPLGVPLTFQVLVVLLIALLLEPRWAAASVGIYLLLGAAGVPVFAGGRGGFGVMFGPTGGFLFGFLAGAWLGSAARLATGAATRRALSDVIAVLSCLALIYAFGLPYFALVSGLANARDFVFGLVPVLVLVDSAKALVAVGIAGALRRAGVVS